MLIFKANQNLILTPYLKRPAIFHRKIQIFRKKQQSTPPPRPHGGEYSLYETKQTTTFHHAISIEDDCSRSNSDFACFRFSKDIDWGSQYFVPYATVISNNLIVGMYACMQCLKSILVAAIGESASTTHDLKRVTWEN